MSRLDATEPYTLHTTTALAPSRTQRIATLEWTDADGAHERAIDRALTVGSAPSCDVVIGDPSVSRMHVSLTPVDDGVEVRDLGSTNGTFCDALRIREAVARDELRLRLGRVDLKLRRAIETTDADLWPRANFGPLVGRSTVMRGLFQQLSRLARSDETVMIHGETGSGKEVVARAIHEHSPRRGRPYIVVDCSALPPQLVESELFGHTRGSFTGAVSNKIGQFEAADGGTLFLDEIGELPLADQAKFLRALESRTIRRIGEAESRPVNVRVISATHRDLREMVNERTFREDLYFRLAVLPVRVPKLRERLDDVPMLIEHFITTKYPGLAMPTGAQMEQLMALPWKGNVRDVRNVVARAAVLGWDAAISADAPMVPSVAADATQRGSQEPLPRETFYEARKRGAEQAEREYVARLMARFQGNIVEAAAAAGMHHTYLRKKLKEFEG